MRRVGLLVCLFVWAMPFGACAGACNGWASKESEQLYICHDTVGRANQIKINSLEFDLAAESKYLIVNIKVEGVGLMGGQDGQERRSGFHHPST
jgi:hypothetical protein